MGRCGGWFGRIFKRNSDEFERGTSLKERCQIPNRNICSRGKNEPRKGGEVETTKVCVETMQIETCEIWQLSPKNDWEFDVHFRDIGVIGELEVPQLWRCYC